MDSFELLSFFSCAVFKASIIHRNILRSICSKRKLQAYSYVLIKVGAFLAEVIGKILGGGEEECFFF